MPNSICFHPSESTRAILSWCSISWACLFWVMHQKQNALPTQTADNISDPIIYSVEDLTFPVEGFLFVCLCVEGSLFLFCYLKSVFTCLLQGGYHNMSLVVHKTKTTLRLLNMWYSLEINENKTIQ